MSTTTYLELCQETQRVCGISGNPIASVSGQTGILQKLVTWVADADIAIQRKAINWDFLYVTDFSVSTVQGSAEYTKPTNLGDWDRDTFYVNYTLATNAKLDEIKYRDYFNNYAVGTQTQSKPGNFIIPPSKNPTVYPLPDAVYTLTANYWRTPLRMSANSSTSLIPENYIRAIIARAKMYYAIDQEAQLVYGEAENEFTTVLAELKSNQLPGWKEYNMSDGVEMTVMTDGFTDGYN